jgi:hypothetical protein
MIFRRRERDGSAVADRPRPVITDEFPQDAPALLAEIGAQTEINRSSPDPAVERRLVRLRHAAGTRLLESANGRAPSYPAPDFDRLPEAEGLPDVAPESLTPELLRAAILRDGSLLVRGLIDRDDALAFGAEIERSCAERDRHDGGEAFEDRYYEEFEPDPRFNAPLSRPWIKEGGGVLAADSPRLCFAMLELFERSGISNLAAQYLDESLAISAQKTTLRQTAPQTVGAWHQDGAFMTGVRALNVWVSLSYCGEDAPGLDVVPKRLDGLVPSGDDDEGLEFPYLSYQISQAGAERAAGETAIVRPLFEPGDVLLFDELCLHQTGSSPSMTKSRFAIESWFFAVSGFPADYAPLAV